MSEPTSIDPKSGPTRPHSKSATVIGFVVGAVLWLGAIGSMNSLESPRFVLFILDCFALPVIAGILALIRPTRRFGLGLLLAAGLGWLVLGAICGGLFGQ